MVDLKSESWREIRGHEGVYEVSNYGRVRNVATGVVKRPVGVNGYAATQLWRNGIGRQHYVHRLVLEAFVGECPDGLECCHGNGDKRDNRLGNLRWDTRKSNCKDKWTHGAQPHGETHHNAKLTSSAVNEIRSTVGRLAPGERRRLAEKFGISPCRISYIRARTAWVVPEAALGVN